VHVERAITRTIGMKIDFPRLPVGVGLDEVPLVVDMEAVFGDVVLEISDKTLKVDDGHWPQPATDTAGNVTEVRANAPSACFTAPVTPDEILQTLHEAADRVVEAFMGEIDWGPSGLRADQYASDLVADEAVLGVLGAAGIRVLSEESGLGPGEGPVAVVDPLDGSTNASLGLPWFATSLCVVDDCGPWVAVVHDHGSGHRYDAVRGEGARRDGDDLATRDDSALQDSIIAVNGTPPTDAGWDQYRYMGASALDLCAVADGRFAGYVDFDGGLGVWDYLGAMLICREVGVGMVDADGRDLVVLDHEARRSPIAAPPGLMAELQKLRNGAGAAH
jgi:myo-inositol-1(or 4)-monophosphatase